MNHQPKTPKDRLIFALDVGDLDSAERLISQLAPHVGTFKLGSQLFTSVGPMVLDLVHGMGAEVFLDLKFHDIPATVGLAARESARLRAKMFTVHALGGRKMIETASKSLMQMTLVPGMARPMILGVTILTSHSPSELTEIGLNGDLVEESRRLAKLAMESGAEGVVASAQEVPMLREILPPDTIFVTPGIRPAGDAHGDQSRVVTPAQAIEVGATYLVVGRPIRDAADPAEAARRIVDEIGEAEIQSGRR
jgi:orotidine-5'-phosphate decarboxylase